MTVTGTPRASAVDRWGPGRSKPLPARRVPLPLTGQSAASSARPARMFVRTHKQNQTGHHLRLSPFAGEV